MNSATEPNQPADHPWGLKWMRYGKVIDGVFDDSTSLNDLWARVEPGDLRIAGSGDEGSGWLVRLGCMPVRHEGGRCNPAFR